MLGHVGRARKLGSWSSCCHGGPDRQAQDLFTADRLDFYLERTRREDENTRGRHGEKGAVIKRDEKRCRAEDTAVRVASNGTTWREDEEAHTRCYYETVRGGS